MAFEIKKNVLKQYIPEPGQTEVVIPELSLIHICAARYAGMSEIKNKLYDLLDLAADTSAEFDLANNTREYLLSHFSIAEGKTALEKARINKQLYDALKSCGE